MSDKQKAVLDFIRDFISQRHYSPSLREICQGVGINSTSYAVYQLDALEKAGYIQRDCAIARSIRLTERAESQSAC